MPPIDYNFLMPLIILATAPVLSLLVVSIVRNHRLIFILSVVSLIVFIGSAIFLWGRAGEAHLVQQMLVIDRFTLFYFMLIGLAGLAIVILSYPYFSQQTESKEEYYILLQASIFGAAVLVASVHFASLFLGLEILSVSLYAIIAYLRTRLRSIEGGLKYLILAAGSSAFLLFGMALVYIDTGSMFFSALGSALDQAGLASMAGLAMMLVGVGFKLALVPFHPWTPDIYEGAPAPVSALIATISKGSMIGLLLRFIHETNGLSLDWLVMALAVLAIASMLVGNILALQQDNIKRLLAYSSIAHLGYILVAVVVRTDLSVTAVTFYLVAYFISILGTFGTLAVFSTPDEELEQVEDLKGLFWTRPALSLVFSAMFFSLVGIPLTAGFIGKFYIVWAAISDGHWILALVLVIGSVIGLYYYLRVIKTMLSPIEDQASRFWHITPSRMGFALLMVLGILVIFLGVYPTGLIDMIRNAGLSF